MSHISANNIDRKLFIVSMSMFSESRNPNVAIILVCGGCGSHFQNGRFEFSMFPILANNGDRNLMLVSISRFSGSAFLPRGQWSLLNRFRTGAGPCRNNMHGWGYIASPLCDCGESQTMRHVVNECALTCFNGGISEIHLAQDAAFNWLLRQNLRS